MQDVLVDSNILIDLLSIESPWIDWSSQAMREAANRSRLVINAIIFAEVSAKLQRIEDVEAALPAGLLDREAIPYEAAFLAGKAFVAYRGRGGSRLSPLPDFFIGAHAAVLGYRLLTRDASRYRTYFPGLNLISPG